MIYTVTFNPSLDYYMCFDRPSADGLPERAVECRFASGGKGINVSRVLTRLGVENKALGFVGGFTGRHLADSLEKEGLVCDFVMCKAQTRVNVKTSYLNDTNGCEMNANGGKISDSEANKLLEKLANVKEGDIVAICGSVPESDVNLYALLCDFVKEKGALAVVDTTGANLLNSAKGGTFLVKPNVYELAQIFPVDALQGAKMLVESGCENVLVSAGEDGGILVDGKTSLKCTVPEKMTAYNTVGAGDSMLAGYIYGVSLSFDKAQCLKSAVCAGSAAVYGKHGFDKGLYLHLFEKAKAEEIRL